MDSIETRLTLVEKAVGVPDAAETERIRAERESARVAHEAHIETLKECARKASCAHLDDYRQFEQGLRMMTAAASRIVERIPDWCGVLHQISGKPAPVNFGLYEMLRRMSRDIYAALASVKGCRNRFATIDLFPQHHKISDDLVSREADLIAKHATIITE
jgi:hypothetical protein